MTSRAIFIHVPKTGGTSVNAFMADRIAPARYIKHIEQHDFDEDGFFDGLDYVSGHVRMGQVLPFIRRADWYMFSVVREPMEQIFSHLAWTKDMSAPTARPKHANHPVPTRQKFYDFETLDISCPDALSAFVHGNAEYRTFFDNYQTRYFLNAWHAAPLTYFECKIALANMKKLDLVGTTGQLGEVMKAAARDLGLKPPAKPVRHNVNGWRKRYGIDETSPLLRAALADFIKYDEILHREAAEMFARRRKK
ncbi:MAG: hypothetical protein GC185_10890 [Alphaproteobacteria bacterium]|nr:hypothetical protein [Alphaproteobacteria bacterium]